MLNFLIHINKNGLTIIKYSVLLLAFTALISCNEEFPIVQINSPKQKIINTLPLPSKVLKNLPFDKFTVEDGLSSNSINCLFQDSKGFLWIGTDDGLNRYDGYEFKQFKHNPKDSTSISDNVIQGIDEDSEGNIWLVTGKKGVSQYNILTEQFSIHTDTFLKAIAYQKMLIDNQDKIWFPRPFSYFDVSSNQFIKVHSDYALDFCQLDNGRFFIVSEHFVPKGPNEYHIAEWIDSTQTLERHIEINHTAIGGVNEMITDNNGNIWVVGQEKSFAKYQINKNEITYYNGDSEPFPGKTRGASIKDMYHSSKSNILWLASWGMLERLDLNKETNRPYIAYKKEETNIKSLSSSITTSVIEDKVGNLWVGTMGGGLNKYAPSKHKIQHFYRKPGDTLSLSNNTIETFLRDSKDRLWVGTQSGLNLMNEREETFKVYLNDTWKKCNYKWVTDVTEDPTTGLLWLSYWGAGINSFNPEQKKYYPWKPDNIRLEDHHKSCIFFSQNIFYHQGNIFVSSWGYGMLIKYNPSSKIYTRYSTSKKEGNNLKISLAGYVLMDSKNTLWLGEYQNKMGIQSIMESNDEACCTYQKQTNSHHPFKGTITNYFPDEKDTTSFRKSNVLHLHEDKLSNIWAGTDAGLQQLDRETGKFKKFGLAHGLPNETVNGILEDDAQNLWLSTNKGIAKFNIQQEKVIATFDINDGLQGNQFLPSSCYKDKDGNMYFGGSNGFNQFHPDEIAFNQNIPEIAFTAIKINQESRTINPNKTLELPYDSSTIQLAFSALDLSNPSQNKYSYRLHGLEDNYSQTDYSNEVIYHKLSPGKYTFHVKGSNNDGFWNEVGAQFSINVLPPWWQTNWFYTLCFLALVASIWAFIRFRIRQISNQKEKELMLKHMKIQTQLTQMNPHFLYNVLNSLAAQSAKGNAKRVTDSIISLAVLMRAFLHSSVQSDWKNEGKDGLESTSEIALETEVELLRKYIEFEELQYGHKFSGHLEVAATIDVTEYALPPMMIQPFVENAIKNGVMYKDGKGAVWVVFNKDEEDSLICTVEDDGIGREAAKKIKKESIGIYKSQGTRLVLERKEVLNELGYDIQIQVDDRPKGGTIVTIKFALKN